MRKPPSAKNKRRYDLNKRMEASRKAARTRRRMRIARNANSKDCPQQISYNS